MKILKTYRSVLVFTAVLTTGFFSCASAPVSPEAEVQGPAEETAGGPAVLLPLSTGWYQYDFERTFKGIEDEYNFALSTGMKMVEEVTAKYTGVVVRFEGGLLYDPVTGLELSIDDEGRISCLENASVKGELREKGSFFWSGLKEEHGRLNTIFVKGKLKPLPASIRGGRQFDGVYHTIDSGTGREQLVRIGDGFYTWHYLEETEDAAFTPWPTLIGPEGSFSFSLEMTTVLEMGEYSKAHFSTGFTVEGKVIPGKSISLEEFSRTTGMGTDQGEAPQIYAGTMIRAGEFPNEAIPKDIETLVRAGKAAVRAGPKPDRSQYPSWYLNPPAKQGFICAAGEKTFEAEETAFAMAEAAAAANIAERLRVHIEEMIEQTENGQGTRSDSLIKSEAMERLPYRIVERTYNKATSTAFVLVELNPAEVL